MLKNGKYVVTRETLENSLIENVESPHSKPLNNELFTLARETWE